MSWVAEHRASEPRSGEGRLANVAGVVLRAAGCEPEASRGCQEALAGLFERVCEVAEPGDGSGRLELLAAGLAAVDCERVVVVDAAAGTPALPLVLALTAFPEDDVVVPDAGTPTCAIYRREVALAAARRRLAAGDRDPQPLLDALSVSRLPGADREALLALDPPQPRRRRSAI